MAILLQSLVTVPVGPVTCMCVAPPGGLTWARQPDAAAW